MPKNQVSDPITDQEIAFARLVLSGTMTDRRAAEAVGLNSATAAYTKSIPRVRAYMLEHRAAVREHLVQTETEGLRRLNLGREQVLARLWEIANLSPEMTRSSITGQVKALAMIVAIEGLIPNSRNLDSRNLDRRNGSSENQPAPPPASPGIYVAKWLRERQGETTAAQPSPDPVRDEDGPGVLDPSSGAAADPPSDPSPDPSPADRSNEEIFVHPVILSEAAPPAPHPPVLAPTRDTRVPFSIPNSAFARRR
jgi:hypothetical protein